MLLIIYYLTAIGVIASFVSYGVGYAWLKKVYRVVLRIKDREAEEEFPEFRYIESDLVSDYSHNYPYFRISQAKKMEDIRPTAEYPEES